MRENKWLGEYKRWQITFCILIALLGLPDCDDVSTGGPLGTAQATPGQVESVEIQPGLIDAVLGTPPPPAEGR